MSGWLSGWAGELIIQQLRAGQGNWRPRGVALSMLHRLSQLDCSAVMCRDCWWFVGCWHGSLEDVTHTCDG